MYRVNYGNGQVSENFSSKLAALRHIDQMDMYREMAFVQRREGGEWFGISMKNLRAQFAKVAA